MRASALLLGWLAGFAVGAVAAAQETAPSPSPQDGDTFEEEIDVVGLTPLDGAGVDADELPWTEHSLDREQLDRATPLGLGRLLEDRLPGVHLNHAQSNPLQPDLFYRGFSTSPLLGAAQEMAVFVDGVRVNEVFGDALAWDLVPTFALERVELSSGANPVYGVNTLGGALALQTREGHDSPLLRTEVAGGSFGRRGLEASSGGAGDRWGFFAGANLFDEDGWRDVSPSRVRQGLAKVTRSGDRGSSSLALGFADNDLIGNGPAPLQLVEIDRPAVFTHPDQTENRLAFPRLRFDRQLSGSSSLEGVVYFRGNDVATFNADAFEGDDTDEAEREENDVELPGEPEYDGVNNRSRTEQNGYGASIQSGWSRAGRHGDHRLVGSLSWDEGEASFDSTSELAWLTEQRSTVGSGQFREEAFIGVETDVRRLGLGVAYHASPLRDLAVTAQARFADSRIVLRDRIGTDLDGEHSYDSLLPSLGFAWRAFERGRSSMTLFGGVSRSSRVPTPVELTCADPDDPCPLPNAFLSDPPLDQVLTTSAELGMRGRSGRLRWNAALFRADSDDDLIFVSSGAGSSSGFFTNVDATRRQGIELSAQGRGAGSRWTWRVGYTYVEATFEDALALSSPAHPDAEDGEIFVERGDLVPGVPRHQFRASLDASIGRRLRLGGVLRHDAGRYYRGDEANLLDPIPSATVGDLWLSIALPLDFGLDLRVTNVTDGDDATFGALGEADEVLSPDFDDPRFVTPGEPRAVLLTFRALLDSRSR